MIEYWRSLREAGRIPPAVRDPEEMNGGDTLCIACTQTDLRPAEQRRLVRRWCDLLPGLSHVRTIYFTTRVPQALFDAACQVAGIEGTHAHWSGIKNLDAVRECASSLRYLHLGSSTGIASIEPLGILRAIQWLGLENLKRIHDFGVLARLTTLVGLYLEGSMWSTQRVDTLAPIASLRDLRYLSIANLRSSDRTLAPLYALRSLETFQCATWWDAAELQEIKRLNPGLARPS